MWLVAGFILAMIACLAPANARAQPANVTRAGTPVTVGVYMVGLGNYDSNKGTYTVDFYMWLEWDATDTTFDPLSFEFMNGRASSKDRLSDDLDPATNIRTVWYRIQASLFYTPEWANYPFDQQTLIIVLEDSKLNSDSLVYQTDTVGSGIDESVIISGWEIQGFNTEVSEKSYPWGETYSRLTVSLTVGRAFTTTAIKTLLPPIIFCVISGLSFAFKADKIANRIGFGTSMLISAVMFHISQTSALPPMPSLIMIDKIMISAYSFLAMSLIVTTFMYIDEEFWKDVDYTKIVNRGGAVVSIILPFAVFALLNL
jgi:hypothetical protein